MKKLYLLAILTLFTLFSCQKKGYVDVQNLDFWVKNNTAPFEVQFYLDVHYQPDEISYHWDFGDGTTSTEKEPVHVYNETGKYTVKLQIVNYKTVYEKSLIIDVSQDPMPIVADFDYESTHYNRYYAPCEIKFYNKSQYADKFFWNFGDGTGSEEANPTHIYQTDSTYNIYLHAISGTDTGTSVFQLPILPPPSTINIDVVTVWLPEELMGGMYSLEYYTDNFHETPSHLNSIIYTERPFGWVIGQSLYYFNGIYDNTLLYFEIWDENYAQAPIYDFGIKFSEIQDKFYPDTLFWDSGNGYSAEVLVSYED